MINFGSVTRARATDTRCRWPLRVEANPAEERAGPGLRLSARDALDQERLDDRLPDRQIRVEAAQRVLEDVLHHAPAAQVAPLARLGL
jgi:hypothetical protein